MQSFLMCLTWCWYKGNYLSKVSDRIPNYLLTMSGDVQKALKLSLEYLREYARKNVIRGDREPAP